MENARVILDSQMGKMFKVGRPNFMASSKKREMIKGGKIIEGHIAKVGEFEGYRDGGFSLTRAMFDTMIRNFESESNPIPVYRGHADLVPTSTGEEPKAAGWILGLRRTGDDLWATMQLTDSMASEVKGGEFRFTSIYARMNETDRKTGSKIGARLVSLAITNQPFIDGLQELTLSDFGNNEPNKLSIYRHKEISMSNKPISLASLEDLTEEDLMKLAEKVKMLMEAESEEPSIEIEVEEPEAMLAETIKEEVKKDEESVTDTTLDLPIDDTDDQEGVNASMMEEKTEELETEVMAATVDEESMMMLEDLRKMVSEQMGEEMDLPSLLKHLMSVVSVKEEMKTESEEVSMSNLSFALSSVRADLQVEKSKVQKLQSELDKINEEKVDQWANDQIKLGLFHEAKKEDWKKLYNTNKDLCLSLLKDKEPEIVLSKLVGPNDKDSERTINEVFNDHEKRILKGAGIKV